MSGLRSEHFHYPGLLRNPRRPAAEIRQLQERKLARLLSHARAHVPYYREMFKTAGFPSGTSGWVEGFGALPLTSKVQLRALPVSERTADNVDLSRCRSFSTSGTTGIPLKSFFTPGDMIMKNLAWTRAFRLAGARPGQKTAALVGPQYGPRRASWYERLGLWRRLEISSAGAPEEWIRRLKEWRPDILLGYVLNLKLLAEALQTAQEEIPLQAVFQSSALLDEASRRFLEAVFRVPVRDFYGSDEAGCIAWECPACAGYHIAADMLLVEIIKDGRAAGPGEEGEIVVTNFHSAAMPFIRYRQGDVATVAAHPPRCGRSFPLLERIQGRTDDFVILPDGRKLTPHVLYHALDPIAGLGRWRIVQDEPLLLRVECERAAGSAEDLRRAVETGLRAHLPAALRLDIRIVAAIPVSPGQKFRAVHSKLGDPRP